MKNTLITFTTAFSVSIALLITALAAILLLREAVIYVVRSMS